MRQKVLVALLLIGVSAVLGATVLREPIAAAASPFQNVIIGNDSSHPVPVRSADPPNAFSWRATNSESFPCPQGLPAGTRWHISSFALTGIGTGNDGGFAELALQSDAAPNQIVFGPTINMLGRDTKQLTFPQPLVLTSTVADQCLRTAASGVTARESYVVGWHD